MSAEGESLSLNGLWMCFRLNEIFTSSKIYTSINKQTVTGKPTELLRKLLNNSKKKKKKNQPLGDISYELWTLN